MKDESSACILYLVSCIFSLSPDKNGRADHPGGQLVRVGFGNVGSGDIAAMPEDSNAIRDGEDFSQFVGDQDNGMALVA